ncbi:hypothetical protein D3C87_1829740 [compost metagenome]
MFVAQQRVAGGQKEDGAEQVPLQFQPAVGADLEDLAHNGVAGADQDDDQRQPRHAPADHRVDRIDQTG